MDAFAGVLACFICMGLAGVCMTLYDKAAAKKHRRRISEKALLAVAFCGGALPMYAAMRAVRHKTRKKRFMLTLPVLTANFWMSTLAPSAIIMTLIVAVE